MAAVVGWTLSVAQTGGGAFIRIRETVIPAVAFDQDAFRLRNDDGDEATATWKAAANQNGSISVDENFRCRFVVQETGGGSATNAYFTFEYKLNAGSWTTVSTSSAVLKLVLSPNFTDGVDCVQRIGAGTFIADNDGMDENGSTGAVADFTGNDETEIEGCFQIVGADVSNGDTIQIRAVRNGAFVLDAYTNTPTITAIELAAYSLSCESGAFVETGTAAGLKAAHKIIAEAGSLAETGTAAAFSLGHKIAADAGVFSETGSDAALKAARRLLVEAGGFAGTGTDAALKMGRKVSAETGVFSETGSDATLTYTPLGGAYALTCDSGSFTETGFAAALLAGRRTAADAGSFVETGMAAALLIGRRISAGAGAYSETGSDVTLTYGAGMPVLAAEAGAFVLSGQAAALSWSGATDPDSITVSFSRMRQASALFENMKQPALSVAVKQPAVTITLPGETI